VGSWQSTVCEPTAVCEVRGLKCGFSYYTRAQVACENPDANSLMSDAIGPIEIPATEACVVGCTAPNLTAVALTETSINLDWFILDFGDCMFLSYTVEVDEISDKTGAIEAKLPYGCQGPWRQEQPRCTAFSLRSFRRYRFRVMVQCTNAMLASPWSEYTVERSLPLLPDPPTNVRFTSGTIIEWELGKMNDCIFNRYDLELMQVYLNESTGAVTLSNV
jgi:hypothetical protein